MNYIKKLMEEVEGLEDTLVKQEDLFILEKDKNLPIESALAK